jgi:ornithine cyclodeaminase
MNTTNVPLYGPDEVFALLDYEHCIVAVREAMKSFSGEAPQQPLRAIVPIGPAKLFGVMPGVLPGREAFGAKLVSVFGDPSRPGRSAHEGVVVVFDQETGRVKCMADAHAITSVRTAAASAVATDALARSDATRLAIFGCGEQARSHVRAISCVRKLQHVLVWGRSTDVTAAFVSRLQAETGLQVSAVADAREAADAADIICTVTTASTPVLLGKWVRPGTHVNAVGSSHAGPVEVDSELVVVSRYVADSRSSALVAAAEFLNAKAAGLIGDEHIVAEIGEVLLGRVPGRTSNDQITFYKSLGHIVQDLAAADYVHARASGRQ